MRRVNVITGETAPEFLVTGNGTRAGVLDFASDPIREPEVVWSLNFTREYGSELLSFNPQLGQMLSIVSLDDSLNLLGLAIDPTNSQFYTASTTILYALDPVTGETTQIGQTGIDIGDAIGFDLAGNLFGRGIVEQQNVLVSINKASGESQIVGPINARLEDFAARPEDGVVFGLGLDSQSGIYNLYQVDLTTGSLGRIGPSLGRPGGVAFTGIPEPTTLALALTVLAGLVSHHRPLLLFVS